MTFTRRIVISIWIAAACLNAADPFEASAIHPSDPNSTFSGIQALPGGRLSVTNMSIRNLIFLAWHLPAERVTGGPKWIDSEKYSIEAKTSQGRTVKPQEIWALVQTLLADRFRLRTHRESKIQPVYELGIARGGLKMQEAKAAAAYNAEKGSITPWSLFISDLSHRIGRPVIDKTNLQGSWYMKLQYTDDDGKPRGIGTGERVLPGGPSIFTALEEQLGLRLSAAKAPVETLVIDSIEHPSPN